jgi:ubiquinone/menaquinone biosynthesis C-methylase UbiE
VYYRIFSKIYEKAAKKMCLDCADFIDKGSKILDLGCGSGIVGSKFQEFFEASVTGIDIQDRRIKKIPFQIFDGLHIPFLDNSFDIVLISYVLHHAKDSETLLREAKRVSRGKIIIYEDLPEGFLSKLRCTLHQLSYNIFQKGSFWNFKTKKEWEELFQKIGLRIVSERKVFATRLDLFDPVYRTLFILEGA